MSKLYSCPRCQSGNVYAGSQLMNQQMGIVQVFAGCNDCNSRFQNMVMTR